jgi:hypothetical protein
MPDSRKGSKDTDGIENERFPGPKKSERGSEKSSNKVPAHKEKDGSLADVGSRHLSNSSKRVLTRSRLENEQELVCANRERFVEGRQQEERLST